VADLIFLRHVHLGEGLIIAVGLENGVPAERVITGRRHDLSLALADEGDRLSRGSFTERKDALRVCSLVFEANEHLVEALSAHILKEVLDVGARHAAQRIEAQTHIFGDRGATNGLSCQLDLCKCNLVWLSLHLIKIKGLVSNFAGISDPIQHML